jgi:lipoprotein-anchoring transpeptidase ErfK/SrfK
VQPACTQCDDHLLIARTSGLDQENWGMVFVVSASAAAVWRSRRAGSGVPFRTIVALLLLTVTGCTSSVRSGSDTSPSTSAQDPVVRVSGAAASVSYLTPVRLVVSAGTFTSVQVNAEEGDQVLEGSVSGDGTSWVSESPPKPSFSYLVVATVKNTSRTFTRAVTFTVAPVPDNRRVAFTVTPDDAETVGIGQPIVVRFLTPVTERAAMEKVMLVDARAPSGMKATGSWHWLNSQEVHWRPQRFFAPGTTVHLDMRIAGVKAAADRYGRRDYSETFTIGASHITRIDTSTHRVRVYRDGTLVDNWPTGTGRPGLETYSGTYVVLGKSPVVQMDSCSARITCDKNDPDYYNEKEFWATRVTASGTFLHAASWDAMLGRANTSHGCIHLTDTDAKDFYNHAVTGDVVIVSHTGRGPQERIATQDPGLYDWNLSWTAWTAGSALARG